MGKHGNIHCGIPAPDKKVPIIPLGNKSYTIKNKPIDYSLTSLLTETRRMHKKVTARFSIKNKELSTSSIFFEPSCVPTEVDYGTKVHQRQTQDKLNKIGNA